MDLEELKLLINTIQKGTKIEADTVRIILEEIVKRIENLEKTARPH